jgi:hypothetical protein
MSGERAVPNGPIQFSGISSPNRWKFSTTLAFLQVVLLFLLASKALSLPLATSGKKLNVTDVLFFGYLTLR